MIAAIVKTVIVGLAGWAINEALGHKIVAKAILVLIAVVCVNIVVQGCQPYVKRTEERLQKVEQILDRVNKVEEKTDKTGDKIRKFLLEPPGVR